MTKETALVVMDIVKAMRLDLDWGSHHLNNWASRRFSEDNPILLKKILELEAEAMRVLES